MLPVGKAHIASRPSGIAVLLAVLLPHRIVVGQHLIALQVALAGKQDAGPGILEHGNQIRQHVTLRIEVLARLPEAGSLPAPAPLALVEIAAVALPQGDMAPGKSLCRRTAVERRDQRPCRPIDKGHDPVALFAGLNGAAGQRHELLDEPAVGIEFDACLAVGRREQRTHRVVHRPDVLLAEGIVGQPHRGVELHAAARCLDALNPHPAAGHLAPCDAGQRAADLLACRRADFGRSSRHGPDEEQRHQQKHIQIFPEFHAFTRFSSPCPEATCRPW